VRGVLTWGTPKGNERRTVPIPGFLVDELAVHVAGKDPAGLVFTGERGGVLRAQVFQRAAFTAAADTLGVLFLAYTGVRWGEMAALCVGRLDLMRRRAESFKSGRRRLYACLDRISPARSPRNTGGVDA